MQTLDNEITTKYDIFPDKMPKGLIKTSTELEEIITKANSNNQPFVS